MCLLCNTGIGEFSLLNAPTIITAPFVVLKFPFRLLSLFLSTAIPLTQRSPLCLLANSSLSPYHIHLPPYQHRAKCLPSCQQVNKNPHPPSGRGEACSMLPAQVRAAVNDPTASFNFIINSSQYLHECTSTHKENIIAVSSIFAFLDNYKCSVCCFRNAPDPL